MASHTHLIPLQQVSCFLLARANTRSPWHSISWRPLTIDLSRQQQSRLEINLQHVQPLLKMQFHHDKILGNIMPTSPMFLLYRKIFSHLQSLLMVFSEVKTSVFHQWSNCCITKFSNYNKTHAPRLQYKPSPEKLQIDLDWDISETLSMAFTIWFFGFVF